ncbi:WhiB family transcriptional regulator [Kitasatospora fiedleri]|uniref:WhiB family transcriptional regulator n=1 Tax=Kitasatospora fiedleri TaxID=2991545 RepID=UPI00384F84A9
MVCNGCPVVAQCLREAMKVEGDAGEKTRHGIRGGLSPKGRKKLGPHPPARHEPPSPPGRVTCRQWLPRTTRTAGSPPGPT